MERGPNLTEIAKAIAYSEIAQYSKDYTLDEIWDDMAEGNRKSYKAQAILYQAAIFRQCGTA